jgi:hypothetical protein
MIYDSARAVTVLFGGADNSAFLADTWEWNGTTWTQRAVNGPSPRCCHAMAYDAARAVTVLFGGVTGMFATPNGETWELQATCAAPSITIQPVSQTVCPGSPASFTVTAAGEGQISYQWRRGVMNLTDEPDHISGSNAPTLLILNATESDEGTYTCIVSNACGNATSDGAMLDISPADFNRDGVINSDDFFNYLACFFNPQICAPPLTADFNHDGTINSQDYFDFLTAFFARC